MTLEELGAYIKLLCFQADRGPLKEGDILKKIPAPVWEAICCKFEKADERYFNVRLQIEKEKRKNFTESRRKNLEGTHKATHMDNHKATHKGTHKATHMSAHMENENKDKDKDIIKDNNKKHNSIIDLIIEDLNIVLDTSYKLSADKTRELIRLKLDKGYTLEDFKKVHRIKHAEWSNDPKMQIYLRPETLYSNKFEGYLNQKTQDLPKGSTTRMIR